MVEVPAPIDSVEINIAESFPPQYFVAVKSGLPNACYEFDRYEVDRDGETVRITVTNLKPEEPMVCAEIYGTVESNIALGIDFDGGKTYMQASPIETVEVVVSDAEPAQYSLNVVSRLPRGSNCSAFNGYDIVRQFANTIEVGVTHLEVAENNVPCTRDLPVVETEIPLGANLVSGEEYTVTVNDQFSETFTAVSSLQ